MSDFNRNELEDRKLAEFKPAVRPTLPEQTDENEYEEEYEASSFNKFKVVIPIIILAVVCFVSYAWYTDKFAISHDSGADLPVVKASTEALREKPEDPGGMKIINRDKRVYDTISGNDSDLDKKENILPSPEEPIAQEEIARINGETKTPITPVLINKLPDEKTGAQNTPPQNITPAAGSDANAKPNETKASPSQNTVESAPKLEEPVKQVATNATTPINPIPSEPVKIEASQNEQSSETAPAQVTAPATPPASSTAPAVKTEKAVTEDDIKDVAPKKPTIVEKKPTNSHSGYRVQLGSYKSQGDAEISWKNIKKKFSAILSGQNNYIEKADLGVKGVYYRLQISGLKNEADARKLCQTLVEKKQECFFVGK